MPPMEHADRVHDAVLWEATGRADKHGKPQVGPPQALKVRWTDDPGEVGDGQGGTIAVAGKAVCDRLVPIGSLMWRGAIEDLPEGADFSQEEFPLMIVKAQGGGWDMKGRVERFVAVLSRYGNTHPGETGEA